MHPSEMAMNFRLIISLVKGKPGSQPCLWPELSKNQPKSVGIEQEEQKDMLIYR